MHKHIGDSVQGPSRKAIYRIVGTVVLPTLAFPQPLADGALFTPTGLRAIYDTNSRGSRNLVAIVAATARPADVIAAASDHAASPLQPSPAHAAVLPVEIHHVRDVAWLPRALAALLGGLALVAVGHALLTGIRSRRGDLAVLKTLGFVRAQVRSVIMWQAIILAAIGIVVGGPIGIVVGRLAWQLVADALGVRPVSSVSPLMLAIVPGTLCLALVLAILPARRAANIQPAQKLRIE